MTEDIIAKKHVGNPLFDDPILIASMLGNSETRLLTKPNSIPRSTQYFQAPTKPESTRFEYLFIDSANQLEIMAKLIEKIHRTEPKQIVFLCTLPSGYDFFKTWVLNLQLQISQKPSWYCCIKDGSIESYTTKISHDDKLGISCFKFSDMKTLTKNLIPILLEDREGLVKFAGGK